MQSNGIESGKVFTLSPPKCIERLLNKKGNLSPELFAHNSFSQATDTTSNLDIDTILKLKTIIETFNKKDDSRANLLYSLKPYLRESRQKKIDQYVNIFKLTAITNLFKKGKGD